MASEHGSFCWYELATSDPAAAAAFYGHVLGWTARAAPQAPIPYTMMSAGEHPVAGVMALPEAAPPGTPPHWSGQVAVDSVDATATQASAAGAHIVHPPTDLPIGRFAVLRDPQGGYLTIFQGDMPSPPAIPSEPGFGAWRGLMTDDLDAGFDFYAGLFGWTRSTAMDMGPMGVYQLFAHRGVDIGGMMRRPPGVPVTAWAYYFSTDAIGAAIGRIAQAGGTIVNGPHQVPGDQWIVQATDPQGAFFALVSDNA